MRGRELVDLTDHFLAFRDEFETLRIRNRFFIDTNNFFRYCKGVADQEKRLFNSVYEYRDEKPPKLDVNAEILADIARWIFSTAENHLAEMYVEELLKKDINVVSNRTVTELAFNDYSGRKTFKNVPELSQDKNTLRLQNDFEAKFFASRPKPRAYYKKALLNTKAKTTHPASLRNIENNLELLEQGKLSNATSVYDLDLYEGFIEKLSRNSAVSGEFGFTNVNFDFRGGVSLGEKGVDTLLVLDVVECLKEEDLSIFCLITNDNDFYPLVEYIKRQGKKVFVFCGKGRIAKRLSEAAGKENIIPLESTLHGFPQRWTTPVSRGFEEMYSEVMEEISWGEYYAKVDEQMRKEYEEDEMSVSEEFEEANFEPE
jgi:uncharacterized LabA/DUF88 family protein